MAPSATKEDFKFIMDPYTNPLLNPKLKGTSG